MKNERQAVVEGLDMAKELNWAGRHLHPNTTFTKVMAFVGGAVSLLMLFTIIQDPQGWPMIFFVLMFGSLPIIAPSVIRSERANKAKAEAIIAKWDKRVKELKEQYP